MYTAVKGSAKSLNTSSINSVAEKKPPSQKAVDR